MARGPKKHLKRITAPKHWMLDKLSGIYAPRPTTGPHKLRECLPLAILLRNRMKYALNRREIIKIVMQRLVKIDHKVRTDICFPIGLMDVIQIDRIANGNFRLMLDAKGRFRAQRITPAEAKYKLCRVNKVYYGKGNIPHICLNDGRTVRYPDPAIKVNDTVKWDLEQQKITEFIKCEVGNLAMVTGGKNIGRVGVILHKDRHPGAYDLAHLKDAAGNTFATRLTNVFVIGKGTKSLVTLPRSKGIRRTILEERDLKGKRAKEGKEATA